MSEEEKKAIEFMNNIEYKQVNSDEFYDNRDILINLIDKQQKEIERLKKKNKRYEKIIQNKDKKCEELLEFVETEKETDYISKDKIKQKIEELEKHQEENRKELYNAINSLNFRKIEMISNRISKNIIERDILKELLEE